MKNEEVDVRRRMYNVEGVCTMDSWSMTPEGSNVYRRMKNEEVDIRKRMYNAEGVYTTD